MCSAPINDADSEAAPRPVGSSGRKLNILQIAHKFPPFVGGIEVHTYEIGRRLAKLGHRVTVLTGDPSDKLPTEEMVAGMRVCRVPVYPRSSDAFFAPSLMQRIWRERADVVHVQGFHTLVPPLAMLALLASRTPFVLTFHSGGHSDSLRNRVRGIQNRILRPLTVMADQMIAVSEFEAEKYATAFGIDRSRIVIVPNGAEIDPPLEIPRQRPSDAPLIVSSGRLEKYKGHHRVIAAFAEVAKRRPDAQLRIAGSGPFEAELRQQVSALGLDAKVTIAPIPPGERQKMAALLCEASVVVLLSEYEAHPVAALEAVSLGRRVVASNSTGFAEMARAGLLRGIDPEIGPSGIADIVLDEVDRPDTDAKPPPVGNWDVCASRLLGIYQRVVAARSRPAGVSSIATPHSVVPVSRRDTP